MQNLPEDIVLKKSLYRDHLSEKQLFSNKEMPKVEMIASLSALQKRFDQDHRNAMESLDD